MDQEIYAKVKEIVADLLDIDESEIAPESKFQADLGADSLDLVELIMEFEERFGGEISDEDAQKITTVGEAVKYVEDHMQ
jgi:acyl carrier protein